MFLFNNELPAFPEYILNLQKARRFARRLKVIHATYKWHENDQLFAEEYYFSDYLDDLSMDMHPHHWETLVKPLLTEGD